MSEPKNSGLMVLLGSFGGAALATAICLASFLIAGRANQTVIVKKADEAVTERARISPDDQVITAHHEAAHAVVSMALLPERGIAKLEVFSKVSQGKYLGLTTWSDDKSRGDEAYRHRANALVSLAGGAAEDALFKKTPSDSDPDSDASAFESIAYCEVAHCDCPPESKVGDDCLLNGLLKPERAEFYAQAKTCVEANRAAIIELAKAVILKREDETQAVRTLSSGELKTFFAAHPLDVEACTGIVSTPAPPEALQP